MAKEIKSERIQLRVTPSFKERMRLYAEEKRVDISTAIVSLLEQELRRVEEENAVECQQL